MMKNIVLLNFYRKYLTNNIILINSKYFIILQDKKKSDLKKNEKMQDVHFYYNLTSDKTVII